MPVHSVTYGFGLVGMVLAAILSVGAAPAQENLKTAAVNAPVAGNIRGVIRSPARVALTTDITAPIADVHARDGEAFTKGQPLITFDCRRYAAELEQAEAARRAAAVELRQKNHLRKLGAAGRGEVEVAAAEAARGAASVELAHARMRDCVIEAPFDGRVVQSDVVTHEMPEPGRPLMTIIDDSSLEIELIVPSVALRALKPGTRFSFLVDETGRAETVSVDRIGAEIDPVSQTVRIVASFPERPIDVLAGMSGSADLNAIWAEGR